MKHKKQKVVVLLCRNTDSILRIPMSSSRTSSVGIEINYHLLTSIYVTSILSYTGLEDDANDEK